ncbi:MAG: rhodanese-like domain-containing protein [Cycloclasticus sp.]|nr:rhodanese-like domain-containing protein [Cycloclasticus sp.]
MAMTSAPATQKGAIDEPYRGLPYNVATTLIPPKGVKRISVDELKSRLIDKQKLVLIDVYGAIFREESLDFDGAWLVSTPHKSLPDSTWLPNVGKQELIEVVEDYYRFHLKELTGNDLNMPIVIFCVEDCWMGWNAAKRAREWGYTNVMWFREGIDAWKEKGWPLHDIEPINLPVND